MRWSLPLLLTLNGLVIAEDGALKRAKDELHPAPKSTSSTPAPAPSSTSSSSSSSSRSNASASSDDDDGGWEFVGWIFYGIFYGIEQCFLWHGDDAHGNALMGVEQYPYHDDWHGWYAPAGEGRRGVAWGGELYAEGSWIENDLQRYAIGGRAMFSALMLRTEWNRYFEERADGSHDSLTVGTIDAELGVTMTAQARLGLGLGATITHDSSGNESGLCGVVGLDVFPIKPIIMHGVFTYGSVGDFGTDVMTVRGTIGALWQRYEIYAGWQATRIGAVMLDGPTAGLRIWF